MLIFALITLAVLIWLWLIISATFRVVVDTNHVHIVQGKNKTVAYWGKMPDGHTLPDGNTYYNWSSWIPFIGITRTILPMSIFDITLENYQAYDSGRVPFGIDVKAFFRISDPVLASQRIQNFDALIQQLEDVLRSSIRSILAWADIEEILGWRSQFSQAFTDAVRPQLEKDWGVEVVKNIEFMEIKDGSGSQVITNIQKKKESEILKDSKIAIAENNKTARLKEIEAEQISQLRQQESDEMVQKRDVERKKNVSIDTQIAQQLVNDEAAKTKQKEMEVLKVEQVKQEEINKEKEIIFAEKEAKKQVIAAQANFEQAEKDANATVVQAEASANAVRVQAQAEADRVQKIWQAEGWAISAREVAEIAGKVELMEKMKANPEYAVYLQTIEAILANKEVGVAQAKALESADIKYLGTDWNANPAEGMKWLFTPKGMANLGMSIEAFKETACVDNIMDLVGKFSKLPADKQEAITKQIMEV